jgi:hypothetical protein
MVSVQKRFDTITFRPKLARWFVFMDFQSMRPQLIRPQVVPVSHTNFRTFNFLQGVLNIYKYEHLRIIFPQ